MEREEFDNLNDSISKTIQCPKCGTEYNDDFKYCPNCGKKNPRFKKDPFFGLLIGFIVFVIVSWIFALSPRTSVKYIADRSIQHDDTEEEFTLLFSFKDDDEERISSDAVFEIRIVNDNGEEVYSGTKEVTKNDFGTWSSALMGERYLGSVKIKDSEIQKGNSTSGKIYFTVYKENVFSFDESVLKITNDLPVNLPTLTANLPVTVGMSDYLGSEYVSIDSISYEIGGYSSLSMTVYLSGTKTAGSGYCMFNYKVLDEDNYVVDTGMTMISNLSKGDKFKNEKIYIYDVEPGKNYTIEFYNYSY